MFENRLPFYLQFLGSGSIRWSFCVSPTYQRTFSAHRRENNDANLENLQRQYYCQSWMSRHTWLFNMVGFWGTVQTYEKSWLRLKQLRKWKWCVIDWWSAVGESFVIILNQYYCKWHSLTKSESEIWIYICIVWWENLLLLKSGIDTEIGSWKGLTSGRKQNLYWTGERVLWDMLIESKSDIRQLEVFFGKDWGWKWKWKGLVEQIDWQRLTHCLTLMPWPTWAFCLLFSEGLKCKKTKGGSFWRKKKISSQLCGVGVRLTERELFPRVRREGESKDGHGCDEEAGDDEVEEVVERSPPDPHHEGDVEVRFGTAVVDHFVPGGRHSCEKHIHHSVCIGFPESLHWSNCFASVCHKKDGILLPPNDPPISTYCNALSEFSDNCCACFWTLHTPLHRKLLFWVSEQSCE